MLIKRITENDLNILVKEAASLKTCSLLDSTGYYFILKITSTDGRSADICIDIFKLEDKESSDKNYFGIYISPNDDTPFAEFGGKTLEDISPVDIEDYTKSLDPADLKRAIRKIVKSYIKAIKSAVVKNIVIV